MISNLSLVARRIKALGDFPEMKRQPMPSSVSRMTGQMMPKSPAIIVVIYQQCMSFVWNTLSVGEVQQEMNPRHIGL
jgi:hypothetical protein